MGKITSHRELKVYNQAFEAARTIYCLSTHKQLDLEYDNIIGMLVNMQRSPEKWQI